MKKLLVFHPTIAPYRIDFFNDLYNSFKTKICLEYRNLKDQKFDYDRIEAKFLFKPIYLEEDKSVSIWKLLNEFDPNIVIVNEFSVTAIQVLLYKFIKRKKFIVVSMCDDSYNMVVENNDFSRKHRIARRVLTPFLNELILVESRITEWYKLHYNKGIYFPIIKPEDNAIKEYEIIIPKSQFIAEKYNLFGKKIFLFVGRLVALKNVEIVIRAFARLNQDENVFVIVGDGPEKEKLMHISEELGINTIFTGRLEGDELNVWYNIAQLFILPSYQEAFGAVTNEALLAGCKVLISKNAGSQCLVEEGINGYLISPYDIEDIERKMKMISSEVTHLEKVVVKKNQMKISYSNCFNNLVERIKLL